MNPIVFYRRYNKKERVDRSQSLLFLFNLLTELNQMNDVHPEGILRHY